MPFYELKYNPGKQLFPDMPGYQAPHGGTIPPHILVTNLRPDIFIVDEAKREVIVFELTCPWDTNVVRMHAYKEDKYAPLVADLSHHFTAFHLPLRFRPVVKLRRGIGHVSRNLLSDAVQIRGRLQDLWWRKVLRRRFCPHTRFFPLVKSRLGSTLAP